MNHATLSALCQSAVLYATGSTGRPLVAGGVSEAGAPWLLIPGAGEADLRILPVANLKEEAAGGGIVWRDAGGEAVLSIVPLRECEEFEPGAVQAAIDDLRSHYLDGDGRPWLDDQVSMLGGRTTEWTGPGSI